MNIDLASYQLLPIFLISLVVSLAVAETGRQIGVRAAHRGGDDVAALEGAILGLLALIISFTFAMSLSRFESRRDAVLNEAVAISTTALRARLLPAPESGLATKILQEYVQLRIDMTSRPLPSRELDAALHRMNELHEELWQQVKTLTEKNSAPVVTGPFIQSASELIGDEEKHLTAIRNRVPNIVLIALYVMAITASGFIGYSSGLKPLTSRPPVYVMCTLICAVILLIQDIDRPNAGVIEVSLQPMTDAAAGLEINRK